MGLDSPRPNVTFKLENSSKKKQISVQSQIHLTQNGVKPKRVEEPSETVARVARANCCLMPNAPENYDVMKMAVGDGSEYIVHPKSKVFRIRRKFFALNFLQSVTEDFMSI